MTPQQIRDAIAASPELQALQAEGNHGAIATALSAGRTKVASRMVSARGLAESLPGGPIAAEIILMKLEGARDTMLASGDQQQVVMGSLLRRQLSFLAGDGLDFGSPALRAMLDQFGALGILTADEVAALKTIGVVADPVSADAVRVALHEESVKPKPGAPTWSGQASAPEWRDGMVRLTITYTCSDGRVKAEPTWADDLTPARVADIIARRVESLQRADAALSLYK